jgi:hypothetical protein
MDDLAAIDGRTPEERAYRARETFELYARTYPGSEIRDLITDLAHLADIQGEGGEQELASAHLHYSAEIPDEYDD